MDDAVATWQVALEELARTVSAAVFQTCFQGSAGLAWVDDCFTVAAPHRFAQEWIDVRYRAQVEEALARAVGRPLGLVVAVVGPPRVPPPRPGRRRGEA